MSNLKLRFITAAASLIVASATASAQNALMANIPFDFNVGHRMALPAGDYAVIRANPGVWVFQNRISGKKTMIALGVTSQSRADDPSQLGFICRAENCILRTIQIGHGETGYEVPLHRGGNSDREALASRIVPLSRAATE
ncbi:MAG TPA: hypothetical protein VH639_09945 [Bryobacteraceae bacterium]|jgi:hypothetical protein